MIVLYNPRSTFSPNLPLPMSLLSLASMIDGEREWEIIDGNVEPDPVAKILDLGRRKPLTAIGVTVMAGPQLQRAIPHSRQLKAALPGVPILWGGYFPAQHDDVALRDGAVDFCVRGQGERTFVELLDTLEKGGDLSAIRGLSYRLDGDVHKNPDRPLEPLDDLPDWPYERLPMDRYLPGHYLGRRVTAHHSSYGCPFACAFCAIVSIVKRRWVGQSPERVESILRHQKERYGADAVQFHDMDFFIQENRTAEISDRIRPLGMSWWALGRVDELVRYKDSTWRKMADSGLKMVFCGAEAGSDEVLARMNKGGQAKPELALELAARMKEYGVVPEFSFVLGNPPDPRADVDGTIRFIRKVKEINPATEVILYMYTPVPLDGTLYDEAQQLGFRFPDSLDGWLEGDWSDFALRRKPHNPWLDAGVQTKIRNFERVLNAFYPTTTDTSLRGVKRALLRGLGGWRYKTGIYTFPLELRVFHRLFRYQRPETAGF